MTLDAALRQQLSRLLDWQDSHVGFDKAIADIPPDLRGQKPAGLPYSPWRLLEHLRITQRDILDFCVKPDYRELHWPRDYWPASDAPPSASAWDDSIRQFREDRQALQQLAQDTSVDLTARVPQGNGQTFLRELVLVADHNAYHVAELVVVRRLLGIWHP
jgi:hypothetical protein